MFSGVKIIELASVLAGPSVGQFFAELGAEVIKVENAEAGGDITRSWKVAGEKTGSRSAYFCSVNWGKRSVFLNLRKADDLNALYKLVSEAEIVIASYKPGDAKKLKVDYEHLKKINKNIIYGSITGFGENIDRAGYDAIIQAECGFMSMNGEPGGGPLKMPVALMDILAAHQLKEGLLLAVIHKIKTGEGGFVEVSLAQAAIASLANQGTNYLVAGIIPKRKGSAHPNIAPYGETYTSKDKASFVLAVGSDRQFRQLCELFNLTLHTSKAFASNEQRVVNRTALKGELNQVFSSYSYRSIEQKLLAHHIPFGMIRNMKEVSEAPFAKWMIMERDGLRSFRTNAFKLSFFTPSTPSSPPELP